MAEKKYIKRSARIESKSKSPLETGRFLLSDWKASHTNNFFTADLEFQRSLEFLWGREVYRQHAPRLIDFGGIVGTTVDEAVKIANQHENLPRLNRFDEFGNRVEEVIFHPSHHEAGNHIYGSGMLEAFRESGNNTLALSLFYLSSQNGEAGHNCPIACTAGLIKALQALGDSALIDRYLALLLNPNYHQNFTGAQFLTEVQGGSDVGANALTATQNEQSDGIWRLNGEKWFCSNVTADLALVTARVSGQGPGTGGLGLFLLPRRLENGSLNNIYIRKLKDKLGTRSMATGELDFRDAIAYQLGPTRKGFKNLMTYVINTSRIYNAVAVSGNARRAYTIARDFAKYRPAFGRSIIHFPIVQDLLANMRAEASAIRSGTFDIVNLIDEIELGNEQPDTDRFLRVAINLNKYRSSVLAHQIIVRAIEILGGNGAVETFSILPRLLRDNIVYENWEGTHNVLLAQVHRDFRRYRLHEPFFKMIRKKLNYISDDLFLEDGEATIDLFEAELTEILNMDELTGAIYFRPLMDRLVDLYYAICLGVEGEWEAREKSDRTKTRLATLFFHRHVSGREPKDIAYYDDLVSRLCQ